MSLRIRLAIVAAAVVAVVVAAASLTTYFVMRHELYEQVDSQLRRRTRQTALQARVDCTRLQPVRRATTSAGSWRRRRHGSPESPNPGRRGDQGGARGAERGTVLTERDGRRQARRDLHASRSRSIATDDGAAVQFVRRIDYIDHDLGRLRLILILVSLGGVAAARRRRVRSSRARRSRRCAA